MKSGFIALTGKPNAGKSSLMNALIGEKIAAVSPRAQTTRDRVIGVYTEGDSQMALVDTPGIHKQSTRLGDYMNRELNAAAVNADAVVIVIDAAKPLRSDDFSLITRRLEQKLPVYIALNKTDLVRYEKIYPMLSELSVFTNREGGRPAVKEIIPTSCRTGNNIDVLRKYLLSELKDGEFFFPPDEATDRPVRFLAAEIIREKALIFLRDEVPHGIAVAVSDMKEDGALAVIDADIVCEKASHKAIIIGAGGERLKTIGESARLAIERLIGKKVFLKLFVKTRPNWRDNRNVMSDMGYD
ncbi:MAG: GTPase Era [Clostridiales bacterium]|nr:GTPase Era [Clostridiales bacterium]